MPSRSTTTVKMISLVGPTASGKSAVAFKVAEEHSARHPQGRVAIVSADSRQVYRGLEVITGADIPAEFISSTSPLGISGYRHQSLPIYLFGTAIISPLEAWSVTHFSAMVSSISQEFSSPEDLIILVGGTMLYQQAIDFEQLPTFPGPDQEIRNKAAGMSTQDLREWLARLDKDLLDTMNTSDRSNPRRLVRAIERCHGQSQSPGQESIDFALPRATINHVWYGLSVDYESLKEKITQRVKARLNDGALEEAENLQALLLEQSGKPADFPAWSACGIAFLLAYSAGDISREVCVERWTGQELKYVKRQWTWWKKQASINWYSDASSLVKKLMTLK